MLVVSAYASKKLLEEDSDQVAHLLADTCYKQALKATRKRMGIDPEKHITRTVTYA